MTIQASGRSALILTAALIAASAFGFAGTGASYAAANGAMQLAADAPADATPAATAATDTTADEQAAPTAPSFATGNTVADNTDTATTSSTSTTTVAAASSDDNSAWDKASIIGKIFIACGTLLTLGSAARMFMI